MCDTVRVEPAPDQRFPPQARLKRRNDIRAVFESGVRVPGRLLAVWALRGTAETRTVVVAGRQVGGAVARNRAKRLLREAYRRNRHRVMGAHLALVARAPGAQASRAEVEAELLCLLRRVGCLKAGMGPDCTTGKAEPN